MILPVTQAILSCRRTVVFDQSFQDQFLAQERYVRPATTGLSAVAMVLLIRHAACHRGVEPEFVFRPLVRLARHFMSWGPSPLMLFICADCYLISTVVRGQWTVS